MGEEGGVRGQLEGNRGLVGEEGVTTSQGPNRKQRAHPRWDNLKRVYLQTCGCRRAIKNSPVNQAQ